MIFRFLQAVEYRASYVLWCINGFLADLFNAQPLDKIISAFEIVGIFAVVLEENHRRFERFFRGLHRDEQVRFANALSGCSADDYLPATFLADEANILDGCFRAIARAADHSHLYFV